MEKQTAVEWLEEQLFELRNPTLNQIEILKKAKEMEKEQIVDAFEQGDYTSRGFEDVTSEEYYNINFKSE